MTYDFINNLDKLQAVDNIIGYIEVRFVPAHPVQYASLPEGYLHELLVSVEQSIICPQIVDILFEPAQDRVICSPMVNIFPTESDPWTTIVSIPVAERESVIHRPEPPTQLLLPPAQPVPFADVRSANPTDYSKFSSADLRKLCSDRKIKWRNTRSSGKHMTKTEMVAALSI